MRLFIIIFIALSAFSCSCGVGQVSVSGEENEQVTTSTSQHEQQSDDRSDSSESEETKSGNESESRPMQAFAYVLTIISFLISLFVIGLAFYINDKKIKYNYERIEKRKLEIGQLRQELEIIRQQLVRLGNQRPISTVQQGGISQSRSSYSPNTRQTQQTATAQTTSNAGNISNKSSSRGTPKTIYLEANSDECFFQFYEQKKDTSKFVAHVIPGDKVATFEVIDVERIRSLNTSHSIKQAGTVAIKDAQGIKNQIPGKIHKTKDTNDTDYWVIDEQVTVEFKK